MTSSAVLEVWLTLLILASLAGNIPIPAFSWGEKQFFAERVLCEPHGIEMTLDQLGPLF